MEMDWTPDFCLACDRQTSGEAYCSQSCRLADLENASNGSEPTSPVTATGVGSWVLPSLGPSSGFYLPPPINFSAYRAAPRNETTPAVLGQSRSAGPTNAFTLSEHVYAPRHTPPSSVGSQRPQTSLASSSSGTSLTSLTSLSSLHSQSTSLDDDCHLSEQVRKELRNYANAFDRGRDWKRSVAS